MAGGTPRKFDPAWRTESVLELATAIKTDQAFDRMPALADSLMVAGCGDEVMIRHCRECKGHTSQCWVLQTLTDTPAERQPTDPFRQIDWADDDDKSFRVYSENSTDKRQDVAGTVMWRSLTIFVFIFIAIVLIRVLAMIFLWF